MSLQDILQHRKDPEPDTPIVLDLPEEKGTFYYGDMRFVDAKARAILPVAGKYFPLDEVQVAELEYQVSQFRATKEVIE